MGDRQAVLNQMYDINKRTHKVLRDLVDIKIEINELGKTELQKDSPEFIAARRNNDILLQEAIVFSEAVEKMNEIFKSNI